MNRTSVLVCRDCCCGTARKHPDTDHDAQLAAIRAAGGAHHRVVVTRCLGVCEQSNVVVVRQRRSPAVWLGGLTDESSTEALCAWLRNGGPLPESLDAHRFERPGAVHAPVAVNLRAR